MTILSPTEVQGLTGYKQPSAQVRAKLTRLKNSCRKVLTTALWRSSIYPSTGRNDMHHETEAQTILRRAKDSVEACRLREAEAIRSLADAKSELKMARKKYEALLLAEENREFARRKAV